MISFGDVIAPLTAVDIVELRRTRALKHQSNAAGRRAGTLFDWATMRKLIETGVIPIEQCKLTYARQTVPPEFYLDGGKLNATRLGDLIARGISILSNGLELHAPAIAAACRDAAMQGVRIAGAGAIATTGSGGALPVHCDDRDIIILQMEGAKRWRVYDDGAITRGDGKITQLRPQASPLLDRRLQPGDLLYLPAGHWHECENEAARSLHVGLFINPPRRPPLDSGMSS